MSCVYCGSDKKIVGGGLCNACYQRKWRTGSLEYKRWYQPKRYCSVDGCANEHVAQGLCDKHYRMMTRTGSVISTFGYGDRKNHELYEAWRWQARSKNGGRCERWGDFWNFVADIGEKPKEPCVAQRMDLMKEWGPDNFFWLKLSDATTKEGSKHWMSVFRKQFPIEGKKRDLMKLHGLKLSDYMEMFDAQEGKCAICGEAGYAFSEKGVDTLAVDHCHVSGKIRGLLCRSCNNALGHFKDNIEIMRAAISYLESRRGDVQNGK